MNIVEAHKLLVATNSSLAKQQILRGLDKNAIATLKACYGLSTYGLANIELGPITAVLEEYDYDLLRALATRKLTGDAARYEVQTRIAQTGNHLLAYVINRDMRCGISATSINKVHKGAVPTFDVQLAKEVPLEKLSWPMLAETKFNGVRLLAIVYDDGEVDLKTRNGKSVSLPALKKAFESAEPGVYDGELTSRQGHSDSFRLNVSGRVNSAMHGGRVDESDLVLVAFDYLTLDEFFNKSCCTPYAERISRLKAFLPNRVNVERAVSALVKNAVEAQATYDVLIEAGHEGLILKPTKHLYSFKRSKDWVKMKETKTADLLCVKVISGEGKYENAIGALLCKGKVEGQDVIVKVGSGLSDAQRFSPPNTFLHNIIEVKYNTLIRDSNTRNWSLFLPRFVAVRFDKC